MKREIQYYQHKKGSIERQCSTNTNIAKDGKYNLSTEEEQLVAQKCYIRRETHSAHHSIGHQVYLSYSYNKRISKKTTSEVGSWDSSIFTVDNVTEI